MVKDIDHVELVVSDAEETVEFFEAVGLNVARVTDHHGTSYELKPPDRERPRIEIHAAEGEEAPGVNHIAFLVEELDELTRGLEAEGVHVDERPHHFGPTGRTKSDVRDPDGRRVQLVLEED